MPTPNVPLRKTLLRQEVEARRRWLAGEAPVRIADSLRVELSAVQALIEAESADLDRGPPLATLQRIEAELADECHALELQRDVVRRRAPINPETTSKRQGLPWLAEHRRLRDDATRLRDQRIKVAELRAKLAGGLGVEPPRFVVEIISRDCDSGDAPAAAPQAAPNAPGNGGHERG